MGNFAQCLKYACWLVSVAEQSGSSLTWGETQKTFFLATPIILAHIYIAISIKLVNDICCQI